MTASPFQLKFSEADALVAHDVWGCNCGPAALAAVANLTLDEAARLMTEFMAKGYTPPALMLQALIRGQLQTSSMYHATRLEPRNVEAAAPSRGLIRIQWTGPWTSAAKLAKWAYSYTHWIGVARAEDGQLWVFDINGFDRPWKSWTETVVPHILDTIRRSDGGWYATHIWGVNAHGLGERKPSGG